MSSFSFSSHWRFEDILRWAWYHDYGETPEQSLQRLQTILPYNCYKTCNYTSHFRLSLKEMLEQFKDHILNQGRNYNIDARAIIGAIAWEYEENFKGRLSDYLQLRPWNCNSMLFGDGIGWGSIHTDTVHQIRPHSSPFELQCLRLKADSAITLVAEIMNKLATDYYSISRGIWIRDTPSVLALFFNTGDKLLNQSATQRRLNPCQPNQIVTLTISQNPMANWVQQNLNQFSEFETQPLPPTSCFARVSVQ